MINDIALVLAMAIQAAGLVVAFMVITRRGWWRPSEDSIDWTTTDGCRICWEHGPYPVEDAWTIASAEQARERHQAQHQLLAPLARQLVRLVGWLERWT